MLPDRLRNGIGFYPRMPGSHRILTQVERDLIWTINSASLIRSSGEVAKSDWSQVHRSMIDSSLLASRLEATPHRRVGRYFEQLVRFYLETVRCFEIVAHGLQIHECGQTVGEIDFLYRDGDGLLCHCETAVKFYLHFPDAVECGSRFIGPNAADSFERKMQRLVEHQLQLSEGRFPEVARREAHVKGRIFYHPLQTPPDVFPELLSPDHLKSVWIRESELELLETPETVTRFLVLRKPHWLAPEIPTATDDRLLTVGEVSGFLEHHFSRRRTPQLISGLKEDENGWSETSRTFVVSDQWPHDDH